MQEKVSSRNLPVFSVDMAKQGCEKLKKAQFAQALIGFLAGRKSDTPEIGNMENRLQGCYNKRGRMEQRFLSIATTEISLPLQ